MNQARRVEYFVSRQQECMILPLWRKGHDTKTISEALALPEYEIANRLPKLIERRKMEIAR